MKLRGTAQHIADKYAQLARDALASGDPVAAESYFQHGEHYFRIVTGAQDPQRPQSVQGYARNGFDDEEEYEENGSGPSGGAPEQGRQGYNQNFGRGGNDEYGDPAQQPQPFERHDFDNRQNRNDRPDRNDRNERPDYRRERFQNRSDRPQRADGDRNDYSRGEGRQDYRNDQRGENGRQDYAPRQESRQESRQDYRNDAPRGEGPREGGRYENNRSESPRQGDFPRRGDRRREEAPRASGDEAPGLPAFLMTATRNPPQSEPAPEESPAPRSRKPSAAAEPEEAPAIAQSGEEGAAAPKPRRRRTRYKATEGEGPKDNTDSVDASSAAE